MDPSVCGLIKRAQYRLEQDDLCLTSAFGSANSNTAFGQHTPETEYVADVTQSLNLPQTLQDYFVAKVYLRPIDDDTKKLFLSMTLDAAKPHANLLYDAISDLIRQLELEHIAPDESILDINVEATAPEIEKILCALETLQLGHDAVMGHTISLHPTPQTLYFSADRLPMTTPPEEGLERVFH